MEGVSLLNVHFVFELDAIKIIALDVKKTIHFRGQAYVFLIKGCIIPYQKDQHGIS